MSRLELLVNYSKSKCMKCKEDMGFFYRKFIKGYAKITHPLHKFTSGENGGKEKP